MSGAAWHAVRAGIFEIRQVDGLVLEIVRDGVPASERACRKAALIHFLAAYPSLSNNPVRSTLIPGSACSKTRPGAGVEEVWVYRPASKV